MSDHNCLQLSHVLRHTVDCLRSLIAQASPCIVHIAARCYLRNIRVCAACNTVNLMYFQRKTNKTKALQQHQHHIRPKYVDFTHDTGFSTVCTQEREKIMSFVLPVLYCGAAEWIHCQVNSVVRLMSCVFKDTECWSNSCVLMKVSILETSWPKSSVHNI